MNKHISVQYLNISAIETDQIEHIVDTIFSSVPEITYQLLKESLACNLRISSVSGRLHVLLTFTNATRRDSVRADIRITTCEFSRERFINTFTRVFGFVKRKYSCRCCNTVISLDL